MRLVLEANLDHFFSLQLAFFDRQTGWHPLLFLHDQAIAVNVAIVIANAVFQKGNRILLSQFLHADRVWQRMAVLFEFPVELGHFCLKTGVGGSGRGVRLAGRD